MNANGAQEDMDGPDVPSIKRAMTDHGNKEQRLLRVDQIYSRKDRQTHYVKTAKSSDKPNRFHKTALVVRRIITQKGLLSHVEVDIRSGYLKEIFLDIYKDADRLELNKDPPMASPELFFHARAELFARKAAEKEKEDHDQALINDIGTALRLVEEDYGTKIPTIESLISHNEVTYELLWALFPPTEILIAPKHGLLNQAQALRYTHGEYKRRPNNTFYFGVQADVISHDGDMFGYASVDFEIDDFVGTRKITDLTVYPIRFDPNKDAVRQELVQRGRRYMSIIDSPKCFEYTYSHGIKEIEVNNPSEWTRLIKFGATGRVVLDAVAFLNYNGFSPKLSSPEIPGKGEITTRQLTDDQFLLCAYWINGFSLASKQWGRFAISGCEDIVWNKDAFSKLVIPEKRRNIIHSLVRAHRQDEASFDDLIENKGKGLVGLLTGSAGVGKTLTAEAVAEITQRPLYVVSGGEVGIDADKVDRRVQEILEITRRWSCVLLIDEADVFMATRGHDLARDTLVSIFLRRLEYFRGILILTTNRQEEIDRAFQSRIHFTLHYDDLDESTRATVWQNFFDSVSDNSDVFDISSKDIAQLAKKPLNGRQIKNAVSIATSLARQEGKAKTVADLQDMISILL